MNYILVISSWIIIIRGLKVSVFSSQYVCIFHLKRAALLAVMLWLYCEDQNNSVIGLRLIFKQEDQLRWKNSISHTQSSVLNNEMSFICSGKLMQTISGAASKVNSHRNANMLFGCGQWCWCFSSPLHCRWLGGRLTPCSYAISRGIGAWLSRRREGRLCANREPLSAAYVC